MGHARAQQVHLVTQARRPMSEDIRYRQHRYLIMMAIRTLCFAVAIILFVNHLRGWCSSRRSARSSYRTSRSSSPTAGASLTTCAGSLRPGEPPAATARPPDDDHQPAARADRAARNIASAAGSLPLAVTILCSPLRVCTLHGRELAGQKAHHRALKELR